MNDDPFMPAARRFPRDAWPPMPSEESPSELRPFVLRGAEPVSGVVTAKHRTHSHRTPQTDPTTSDGEGDTKTVPDTWYTQDD